MRRLCLLWSLCACAEGAAPPEPAPLALDPAAFAERAQPVLDRLCGEPTCHGDRARPYFVYTRFGVRAEGVRAGEALSAAELAHNLRITEESARTAGVERSLVLKKPLRPAAGGLEHEGGHFFYDARDPSFVTLACWLSGGGAPGGPVCWP